MTVTLNIKYAGDGSSALINAVPSDSTIEKTKKLIAKANKMTSVESIRIIQRGKILYDDQKLENLIPGPNNTIVLYVTGIPGKVHKPITNNNNQQNIQFRAGNIFNPIKRRSLVNELKNKIIENQKGLLMLGALVIGTLAFAFMSLERSSTRFPNSSNKPESMSRLTKLLISVVVFGGVAFGLALINRVEISVIKKCAVLFFMSILPTFDVEAFMRERQFTQ
ncbi:hypothetical protein TRFO_13097 [Tritrichomonas foetus]|uniref:Ubiquitin-like domain-containing protein n=1 Tax=Tritrichomonas foetus TaxID=1144522 RepID=A0A1J4L062_9EUKA|nr:hypothetical protein TRFO_13097 [Tritrichomonas foetus]|eukprot:OHT16520.1 hypothetical protein TRFO_13097 [Tritrichomonas foetus]